MSYKLSLLALAGLAIPTTGFAFDFDPAVFSFNGFGTVGTVQGSPPGAVSTHSNGL